MIAADMDPAIVITLVTNATMQWAAAPRARSRHAEAQARYQARKKDRGRSEMIRNDQNDQPDALARPVLPSFVSTELSKKDTNSSLRSELDANASNPRMELFNKGLELLIKITGKTPNSCRSIIGRWLKQSQDAAIHVLGVIEEAAKEGIDDPVPWIQASLNRTFYSREQPSAKPLSFREANILRNQQLINETLGKHINGQSSTVRSFETPAYQSSERRQLGGPTLQIVPQSRDNDFEF